MTRSSRITKAVFPVAGLGTRFLPATKSAPKELLPLVDRPLIQYAIDEARTAGIEEFIFVTARGKTAIAEYLGDAPQLAEVLQQGRKHALLAELERSRLPPGSVALVHQDEALGLGHAVWCARHLIGNDPFAVILPDDVIAAQTPCLTQMVEAFAGSGGNMVAAMEVPTEQLSSFGVLDVGRAEGRICQVRGMIEKPPLGQAPSNLAVIGRYILNGAVLRHLDKGQVGAGGEIQLTDAIAAEIGSSGVHGFRFEGQRFDCGSKAGYLRATVAFALARPDLREDFKQCLDNSAGVRMAAE